jgi:hypothetical protein
MRNQIIAILVTKTQTDDDINIWIDIDEVNYLTTGKKLGNAVFKQCC